MAWDFNIDVLIVGVFLAVTLFVGIVNSRKIKNIEDYALGGRKFDTLTLATTIIATWIGGGFLASAISETYQEGLWHIFARFGDVITLLLVGYIIAPRIKFAFGSLSVAETMGGLYGPLVQKITALSSVALCIGSVAVQIKLLSYLFDQIFDFPVLHATVISCIVIVLYSTLGGIKAITFTDVVQFFTFGVILPGLAIIMWQDLDKPSGMVMNNLRSNELFDYSKVFNFQDPHFYSSLVLFLYYTIPGLDPPTFQRILIAKNTTQVKNSFIISALICLFVGGIACFIGATLLGHDSSLDPEKLLIYIINNYSYEGFKGVIFVGIMAMIMSTADSYLNSASVIISNDFGSNVYRIFSRDKLFFSRIVTVMVGCSSVFLAFKADSLFNLLLLAGNFYTPLITMPLMVAIFGFRTSSRVILLAITTGLTTVITWRSFIQPLVGIDSIIPATLANLISIFIFHYILKPPREENIKKSGNNFNQTKNYKNHKVKFKEWIDSALEYRWVDFMTSFKRPTTDAEYVFFVLSAYATIIASLTIDNKIFSIFSWQIYIMQLTILIISTLIIANKVWKNEWNKKYLGILWHLSIFLCLVIINTTLVVLANFSPLSTAIFILNLSTVGFLLGWKNALFFIIAGLYAVNYLFYLPLGKVNIDGIYNTQLQIGFAVIMIVSFVIALLKPQQEHLASTEEKAERLDKKSNHLSERVVSQEQEIKRLSKISETILHNVNHELRMPIAGVINFSEMIDEEAQKLGDDYIQMLSKDLNKSSLRLSTMMLSMLDLATFNAKNMELRKSKFDIGHMVRQRIEFCKKVYLEGKPIKFMEHIQTYLTITADKNYLMQVIDNLIVNAINYSKDGIIDIRLHYRIDGFIEFSIIDEGMGILDDELEDVFRPFQIGSKTATPAGGRGLGLALCRAVIESHEGSIKAHSRKKGAYISFLLPDFE